MVKLAQKHHGTDCTSITKSLWTAGTNLHMPVVDSVYQGYANANARMQTGPALLGLNFELSLSAGH